MKSLFKKRPQATTYLDLIEQRLDADAPLSRDDLAEIVGDLHLYQLRYEIKNRDRDDEKSLRLMRRIISSVQNKKQWQQCAPLNFVASYPRSGNTLLVRSLTQISRAQVFSDMPGTMNFIPVACFPEQYPLDRIVKAHSVPEYDDQSRYVFLMRDGRDLLPSIAYMTFQRGLHGFEKREDTADFIEWTTQHYRFGDWASFARRVSTLREKKNVMIVRYDDLIGHVDTLKNIVAFFDLPFRPGAIEKVFAEKDQVFADIKSHASDNKFWGLGERFHGSSMFCAWAKNRSGSNWQETMNRAAKQKFHETGATEFLTEFGFEQNPNWWK